MNYKQKTLNKNKINKNLTMSNPNQPDQTMFKNKLQEICQKKNNPLPLYDTSRCINTLDHKPSFSSLVTVQYDKILYKTYGKRCDTKKKAEKSAAEKMLKKLDDIIVCNTNKYESENIIYVLVDMENVCMGEFFEQKMFSDQFKFIGFATKNHPSINVSPPQMTLIETIKSDRRDACDILMIGYTSRLVKDENIHLSHIIILTQDHFGHGLVDYIKQISNSNIRCIETIVELDEYFIKYISTD